MVTSIPEYRLYCFPNSEEYERFKLKYKTFNYRYKLRNKRFLKRLRQYDEVKKHVLSYCFMFDKHHFNEIDDNDVGLPFIFQF